MNTFEPSTKKHSAKLFGTYKPENREYYEGKERKKNAEPYDLKNRGTYLFTSEIRRTQVKRMIAPVWTPPYIKRMKSFQNCQNVIADIIDNKIH